MARLNAGMAHVQHVGITVSDLDTAAEFYVTLTGGRLIGPYRRSGPRIDAVTGHPGAVVSQAFVEAPEGGALIELLHYGGVPESRIDPDNAHVGAAHVALEVHDLDSVIASARALGFEPLSDPIIGGEGPFEGRRLLYVVGPDQVRLELVETRHD